MWGSVLHGLFTVARFVFFFFQAEDGIRDLIVTGVQTCALPICASSAIVIASSCGGFTLRSSCARAPSLDRAAVGSRLTNAASFATPSATRSRSRDRKSVV